ncbi:MAG: cytochrome b N-terminal domain-containing protein [Desulfobulbaceae bacterium]|nr:cytochrome b N-terminal domain-containing protein [Desulfobulbaceae bacterium]
MKSEKKSLPGRFAALGDRIAETFGYAAFRDKVLRRRVPKTSWYQGDGATLTVLLAIQVVTGITMTLYYTNGADHAYDSVRHITDTLALGWLVRGIHFWTAGIMVVMLFSHVFRHLLLGGYKVPRQGTWTVGVFQFFLVLTMSFTGYVLRWDERAVYAVRVVLNMFSNVPVIGDELVLLVQGGTQLGSLTLTRFFSVHVWVVPLLLLGLVGIHLYLIILHGVTSKAERRQPVATAEEHKKIYTEASLSEEDGEWFHPHTTFMTGAVALTVFSIAFILALTVGPREMFPEGNLVSQSMPREEWWFWWYSALIAHLPPLVAPIFYWAFPLSLFIGMLLLPLLDRGPNRGARNRPYWAVFVVACVIGLLWLTDLRTRSPWTGWPEPNPPSAPGGVVLSEKSEQGRQLFARYGCNSCHAVSSEGRRFGPDLARLKHRLSRAELHSFILAPPDGVAMPKYRDRITEADLDAIVEFVLVAQTFPRE